MRKAYWFVLGLILSVGVLLGASKLSAYLAQAKMNAVRAGQTIATAITAEGQQRKEDVAQLRRELVLQKIEFEAALERIRNRDSNAFDACRESVCFLALRLEHTTPDGRIVLGTGSGSATGTIVAIDGETRLMTSTHAVSAFSKQRPLWRVAGIVATWHDGTKTPIEPLGWSAECDLQFLKGECHGKPLALASREEMRFGMRLMALSVLGGKPHSTFGEIMNSSTTAADFFPKSLVLSTPMIVPGFSGGPLIAVDSCKLVGINGRSIINNHAQKLSFALPPEAIRAFAPRLMTPGRMHHGSLNATFAQERGDIKVTAVAVDGPANGKLTVGDVVRKVDGAAPESLSALELRILAAVPGSVMRFTVARDGKELDVELTLAALDDE